MFFVSRFESFGVSFIHAVEIFIGVIKQRDKIFISGFGTFSIVKRKARKGRNPKTGEAIKVAAKFTPKFKPARAFKEAVK